MNKVGGKNEQSSGLAMPSKKVWDLRADKLRMIQALLNTDLDTVECVIGLFDRPHAI
jgi:hypothetical protein